MSAKFKSEVKSIGRHYETQELNVTHEMEIEARDMRIEQLERLNRTLSEGYDGAMRDFLGTCKELENTRLALRLVIRRQID